MKTLNEPTVLFVRHGDTGKDDVLKGVADVPLNEQGRADAARLGEHIAAEYPVATIRHSPMSRSADTAQAIGDATGVKSVAAPALGPMDVGRLSGMKKDAARDWMRYYVEHPDKKPPGASRSLGDWYDDFSTDVESELAAAKRDPSKARVNVTHSSESVNIPSVLRGEGLVFRGSDTPPPASYAKVTYRGGRWQKTDVDLAGRDADLS
jgi:broad specificity phosphatase PhoE